LNDQAQLIILLLLEVVRVVLTMLEVVVRVVIWRDQDIL
jgi:hypothetical protein